MAIDRHIVIAADRNADHEVLVHSMTTGETASFSVRSEIERGQPAWSNYVRASSPAFSGWERRSPDLMRSLIRRCRMAAGWPAARRWRCDRHLA